MSIFDDFPHDALIQLTEAKRSSTPANTTGELFLLVVDALQPVLFSRLIDRFVPRHTYTICSVSQATPPNDLSLASRVSHSCPML